MEFRCVAGAFALALIRSLALREVAIPEWKISDSPDPPLEIPDRRFHENRPFFQEMRILRRSKAK
jgi:hypothetical protein